LSWSLVQAKGRSNACNDEAWQAIYFLNFELFSYDFRDLITTVAVVPFVIDGQVTKYQLKALYKTYNNFFCV